MVQAQGKLTFVSLETGDLLKVTKLRSTFKAH